MGAFEVDIAGYTSPFLEASPPVCTFNLMDVLVKMDNPKSKKLTHAKMRSLAARKRRFFQAFLGGKRDFYDTMNEIPRAPSEWRMLNWAVQEGYLSLRTVARKRKGKSVSYFERYTLEDKGRALLAKLKKQGYHVE